jgi:hypothetical protein
MAERDVIIMSKKEARRLYVVRQVVDGKMTQGQAASELELSDRQVRRIVRCPRTEGDGGIVHLSLWCHRLVAGAAFC